ncbi:MAG: hypothetical protein AB7S26_42065 [Sandaracinaceae bacterium]
MEPDDGVDYEAKLLRSVMIRRLVMGVGAITFGALSIAMGLVATYLMFTGSFPGRAPVRMIAVFFLLGAGGIAAGVVTLRRGEIDLDTGKVHDGPPVPKRLIAVSTTGVVLLIGLIAAWPLGVYGWIGGRFSKCRDLLTTDELSALASAELSAGDLSESASGRVCALTFESEAGGRAVVVEIHEDHFRGGYEFHRDRIRDTTPIEGLGDEAIRGMGSGYHQIGAMVGVSGVWVALDRGMFDDADVERVVELLRERIALVEPYQP